MAALDAPSKRRKQAVHRPNVPSKDVVEQAQWIVGQMRSTDLLPSRRVACKHCDNYLWDGALYCFSCWRKVEYAATTMELTVNDPRTGMGDAVSKIAQAVAGRQAGPVES